jgi:hypothetical protein
MPYLIERVKAGRVIEIRKKYSARYGIKGIPRSDNFNPTPEDVEKVNQDNAERSLRQRINANYQSGDFHAVPGFDGDYNPTPEEARLMFEKFIRKARALYKSEGLEFKYIFAMERGQTGQHKIHFHMVINYIDTRKLSAIWPWGRIKYFPLDDSGQYARLASYIIKRTSKTYKSGESPYKKRWNPSRNLIIPVPDNEVVSHSKWRKAPKAIWGYYIEKDKTVNGISQKTGYPYQFYSMVQLNNIHDHKKVRKRE